MWGMLFRVVTVILNIKDVFGVRNVVFLKLRFRSLVGGVSLVCGYVCEYIRVYVCGVRVWDGGGGGEFSS